jgi:tetratricopeptide (TPR) repeat protein
MSKPQPASIALTTLDQRRRYPGVPPFEEQDHKCFFGREPATEELLLRVLSVRLLLQFAPSGVGKTSLLNAGLFPKLRERNFVPVAVRLNKPSESLVQSATRSLKDAANKSGLKEPIIPETADSLWDLLAETQLWSNDLLLLTPVLVFDQFEEVFTLRDEAFRKRFAVEIGELSLGRMTQGFRNDPSGGPENNSLAPDVKIIISLREEYLGKLEEFSTSIPDLFHERLRLAPLSAKDAEEAIVKPASLEGDSWNSPRFEFDEMCLAGLIDFIDGASEKVKVIESLTLQLVCQRAEEIAKQKGSGSNGIKLQLDDFGGVAGLKRLVQNHFETELSKLDGTGTRKRARRMFEHGLLDENGKRLMLEQDEIARDYSLDPALLNGLVEGRLLRREPRNERVFYEISHDRLAEAIAKNRRRELPRWVKLTIAAGVAVILIVSVFAYRANEAKFQAETALGVLLGEDLVSRLREAGLTDALQRVLGDAEIDRSSDSLALALSLRHQGDIFVERGTIQEAEEKFEASLQVLDALQTRAGGSRAVHAERARTLKRIGSLLEDRGEVTKAEQVYKQSIQAWDQLLQDNVSPQESLDAAETWNSLGRLQNRMGNAEAAEDSFTKALHLSLNVLTTAQNREQLVGLEIFFEQGRAMQIYADSALNLASVWDGNEFGVRGAHALALEALRLRPLSSVARTQVGNASAHYGLVASSAPTPNFELIPKLLSESRGRFDELNQWDPLNRRLQWENAAVQLVISQAKAACAVNSTCKNTPASGAPEDIELAILDSIGHFRMLAGLDPDNASLRQDIIRGLEAQARLLGDLGNDEKALALLDEAIKQVPLSIVDQNDIQQRLKSVDLLYRKAHFLDARGRMPDALAAFDNALTELDRLPDKLPIVRLVRYNTVSAKIEILKKLKRIGESNKLEEENSQLRNLMGDPWDEKRKRADDTNAEGVKLHERASNLTGVAAIEEFRRALDKYQQAIQVYPFDPLYWENLRNAHQWIANIDKGLEEAAETQETGARETTTLSAAGQAYANERESALRSALTAAQMARVLSDEKNSAEAWRSLYSARFNLDQFLYNHNRKSEALPLVAQEVLDAEEYGRRSPKSAESLFLLADANVGVGMLRYESDYDGWEEALRKGLAYGVQLTKKEPAKAQRYLWLGEWRKTLGNYLLEAGRKDDAAQEYKLALDASRRVLALKITEEERKLALSYLENLASLGYK